MQRPPSNPALLRGLLFGAGAALACCVGYAIIIMATGIEIGIVAIAVGWAVGKSVRKGTGGRGGRRCQIAAVALTYLAFTFAYVPVMMRAAVRDGQQQTGGQQPGQQPGQQRTVTPQQLAMALPAFAGYALAVPFLSLGSGVSGILGIIIIGVGLLQAWRLTAGDPRPLAGPFERQGAPAVG
jgi:hypothetical protein